MEVGQTGCGKTTLLNSVFNYLLEIKIEQDFRYSIIHETFGTSQLVFQTSEVTIYNIKGMNGLPPIQIIDTLGYGDTLRIKEDMKIISKIELSTNIVMFATVSCQIYNLPKFAHMLRLHHYTKIL